MQARPALLSSDRVPPFHPTPSPWSPLLPQGVEISTAFRCIPPSSPSPPPRGHTWEVMAQRAPACEIRLFDVTLHKQAILQAAPDRDAYRSKSKTSPSSIRAAPTRCLLAWQKCTETPVARRAEVWPGKKRKGLRLRYSHAIQRQCCLRHYHNKYTWILVCSSKVCTTWFPVYVLQDRMHYSTVVKPECDKSMCVMVQSL